MRGTVNAFTEGSIPSNVLSLFKINPFNKYIMNMLKW